MVNVTDLEKRRLKYLVGETLVNGDTQTCRETSYFPTTQALLLKEEISAAVDADYTDPIPHVLNPMDVDHLESPSEPDREFQNI